MRSCTAIRQGTLGTDNKTAAELSRADLIAVVTAAGKRLGEALRCLEEYSKTSFPESAAAIEKFRYRFYNVEQSIAFTLRPAKSFANVTLCVLITESLCKKNWLEVAADAIAGGAECLQLREKELESGDLLCRAKDFVVLCRKNGVISIINDRPDIAILAGADGVHVGQTDLPAREVRKMLGAAKLLGVSTHRIEDARQAMLDGADYIGVGPIFKSSTKPRDFVAGPEFARQVAKEIKIPALGIAGINESNVDEVIATGIAGIAVSSAVIGCDDVKAAVHRLKEKLCARSSVGQTFLSVSTPVGQTFLSVSSPVGQTFLSVAPRSADGDVARTRRHLPHWTIEGATYFLTFRLFKGELSATERQLILKHVIQGDPQFYSLIAAVAMPDHVHLLISPNSGVDLSRVMKGTKGVTAKLINRLRGTTGSIWQEESFDRIVRDQSELDEKLNYMLNNPVKKELVLDGWDYDGWYMNVTALMG